MTDLIGKTLGKYQIVVRVGRGGMARVYKAYQESLDRHVAIKVLHGHLAGEEDFVKRFEREATAMARLRHPHIVQVYDYDLADELYYIVMEFIEGPTLKAEISERLKRRDSEKEGIFTLEEIVRIFGTLADAIDYAHSRGMIHRDLKPGNIMFTEDGQVLLTDFGLARMIYASRHTQTGALSGTPAYMSPEQVEGKRVDERSDVYSLGVLLYELLTGQIPFSAETSYAIMSRHVTDKAPSLLEAGVELPDGIELTVQTALRKDPDDRYQNAGEFADALQEAAGVRVMRRTTGGLVAPIATMADVQEVTPLSSQIEISTSSVNTITSPYRGLYAFREIDAPYFFGRELFTERLTDTLDEKLMAAVVGPSGSGKSSVVFAGLLPRLRQREKWTVIEMRPGSRPFVSLANACMEYLEPDLSVTRRMVEVKRLAESLRSGELDVEDIIARISSSNGKKSYRLLVVDQFEELYTLCNDEEVRHRFPNSLFKAVDTGRLGSEYHFSLVLTLRADFMGQALADRPFADALQEADVKLGPMTRAELGRAIESPAAKKGVFFEAGLVDRILEDVGDEPGNLPLLEFALTLLWERRGGRRLTHAGYDSTGRVEGSLARYADEVYETMIIDDRERARRVFTQMVRPGEGTEDTRRLATKDELGELDWTLARRLADARLAVTARMPDGTETVEIVHEALIRGWGRLRHWMNAERSFRGWQERLRVALRQWEDSGHDEGALLRGVPLGEAAEWLSNKRHDLSTAEGEYIELGISGREQRAAEREAQRRRELEQARQLAEEQQRRAEAEHKRAEDQARSTKRLRSLSSVLAVIFLIAVIAALMAVAERRDATRQADARATEVAVRTTAEVDAMESANLAATRASESISARVTAEAERMRANESADLAIVAKDEAEEERDRADSQAQLALARQLAAQSSTLSGPQLDLSLLLSLEANNISNSAETASSLLNALQSSRSLMTYLRGHPGILQSVAFSPDGNRLATAGTAGTVTLWDISTGTQVAEFVGHDPSQLVNRANFSPDGHVLATASDDLSVIMWDVATGDPIFTLTGHTNWVQSVEFSPDGTRLISGGGDRNILVWDTATGELLQTLSGHSGPIWDLAFSHDGSMISSASADSTLILWDVAASEPITTLAEHNGAVFDTDFSSDDSLLVSGSADTTVIIWDVSTGEMISDPIAGHVAGVTTVGFSNDDQVVATAGADSTLRVWDVDSRQQIQLFGNHNAFVTALKFSPDGNTLASGDGSGTVILWDMSALGQLGTRSLTGHAGGTNKVAYIPNDALLASVGADGVVRFWDVENGIEGASPISHSLRITEPISALAINATGEYLASGSQNGTFIVWDASTGRRVINPISAMPNGVSSISLNADGRIAALGGNTGFSTVWDIETENQIGPGLSGHLDRVNSIALSPDGEILATGGADGAVVIRPMTEVRSGQVAGLPQMYSDDPDIEINRVTFSPDGQLVASGDSLGVVVLWEAATGQQVPVNLTGLFGEVKSLTFSEDGQLLAAGSDEGKVRLWGVENRELLDIELASVPGPIVSLTFVGDDVLMGIIAEGGTFRWDLSTGEISASTSIPADDKRYSSYLGPQGKIAATGDTEGQIQLIDLDSGGLITDPLHHIVPFQGNLFSIAPSPDGAILATASADGTVILWDRASGQPIMAPLLGHSSLVVSLAFSPNGRYVASGSCSVFHAAGNCIGGQVIVWDASTGEAVHVLEDAVGFSQAVSFSPDSTLLTVNDCELVEVAGACLEGSIRLYDISTGQTVAVYSGHDSFIWSAAFSPDGRLLATGSQDNTIIIWDLVTGQPVGQRLENHGGPVRRVSFSPDGHLLASAGFDNIVILWDVSSGQAIGGPLAVYTNNAMDVVFSADGRYLVSSSLDGMINVEDVDLNSWRQRACHIANRNLRPEEWDQFFGDLPYRDTCSGR